ncbi:hypothetical protein H920_06906 [Fukomys damarensis]|uniref:Uncharacterized protein n=1 Tax=Fukomys damarensis TaxID=885580 RepID=A0A091DKY0_FUKDA|nr:hypothetical protein H920_06906 [Fukomys damarensis]
MQRNGLEHVLCGPCTDGFVQTSTRYYAGYEELVAGLELLAVWVNLGPREMCIQKYKREMREGKSAVQSAVETAKGQRPIKPKFREGAHRTKQKLSGKVSVCYLNTATKEGVEVYSPSRGN